MVSLGEPGVVLTRSYSGKQRAKPPDCALGRVFQSYSLPLKKEKKSKVKLLKINNSIRLPLKKTEKS
jgi:hypothetical protein